MNKAPMLLGIDNGGSNIKCTLYDLYGNELITLSRELHANEPQPGYVERDPEELWTTNAELIRDVVSLPGVDPSSIAAVSVCGYGSGICLLDSEGEPTYPIVVSTDARALEELNSITKDKTADEIFAITHFQCCEVQPCTLLPWFSKHLPNVLEKSKYALAVKDYIRYKLTGVIAGEITDMSNNNLIDPKTRSVSDDLWDKSRLIAFKRLFDYPVLESFEIGGYITKEVARVTGLSFGTPVAAGLYDVTACTIGAGAISDSSVAVTGGTWAMSSCFTDDYSGSAASSCATCSPIAGRYLLEQGSGIGAVNLNWYIHNYLANLYPNYGKKDLYRLCSEAIIEAANKSRVNELLFVPYLYASPSNPNAKGAFLGLMGYHKQQDVLCAILEGVLHGLIYHIKLLQEGKSAINDVFFSGGIASSTEWSQWFCDMLQKEVTINASSEPGTMGAAISAGMSVGCFDSLAEAVSSMVHPQKTLMPNRKRANEYKKRYEQYLHALAALDMYHS